MMPPVFEVSGASEAGGFRPWQDLKYDIYFPIVVAEVQGGFSMPVFKN